MSSLWSLQALPAKNRSDAIILPSSQWGELLYATPRALENSYERLPIPGIWDPENGFLIQSTNPASYALNFPTTGANGLYFYLVIRGDADELTWEPVTHEGIRATINYISGRDIYVDHSFKCLMYVCFEVRLTGPEGPSDWRNPYPNRIAKPRLPQTFEIIGRDREGNEVIKYGFVLQKWFAFRADHRYHHPKGEKTFQIQESWCTSLGYRMANINEVTNAVCIDRANPYNICPGNVFSATPPSQWWVIDRSKNQHDRRIGAGLFSEWGYLPLYYKANIPADWFWAKGPAEDSIHAYDVNAAGGQIRILWKGNDRGAMCVTP